VKIMLDGCPASCTGAMLEPYEGAFGAEHGTGIAFVDAESLSEAVVRLDSAGFQVHQHALGDRALRMALRVDRQALCSMASATSVPVSAVARLNPADEARKGTGGGTDGIVFAPRARAAAARYAARGRAARMSARNWRQLLPPITLRLVLRALLGVLLFSLGWASGSGWYCLPSDTKRSSHDSWPPDVLNGRQPVPEGASLGVAFARPLTGLASSVSQPPSKP
jgi:hypothetical protein